MEMVYQVNSLTTDTIAAGDLLAFADITESNIANKLTFANFEGTISHANIAGVVANEHIDHSSVNIDTENGLTGGGSIAATRTLSAIALVNAQTTAYTALAADKADIIRFTGSGGVNLNLTAAATLGNGWFVYLRNDTSGDITVDPNASEQINGGTTLVVNAGQAIIIFCNGTLFYTVGEEATGAGSSSFGIVTGDTGTATADIANDTLSIASSAANALLGINTLGSDGPEALTIGLDVVGLTALGAAPATGDSLVVYDLSVTTNKKLSIANLFTAPALTGVPTTPTAAVDNNTTQIASTAFVVAQIADDAPDQNIFESITGDSGTATADTTTDTLNIAGTANEIATVAATTPDSLTISLVSSAILPGSPTVQTQVADGDDSLSIATTAWVKNQTVNELAVPTADFSMNTNKITGLVAGTSDTDAVNKGQLDAIVQGIDIKASVVCNSDDTSNEGTGYSYNATGGSSARGQITWSTGPTAIDGVTLANADRILNTEVGAAGGFYDRTAQNTWDRSPDTPSPLVVVIPMPPTIERAIDVGGVPPDLKAF